MGSKTSKRKRPLWLLKFKYKLFLYHLTPPTTNIMETGIDLQGDTIHAIPRFGKDRLDTLFVHVIYKYYIKL